MARPQTGVGVATPTIIQQIKGCIGALNMDGRLKRESLAAIALNLGLEATNKPWAGHVLALLCESFDAGAINEIMTHGPGRYNGRYKKEWDKWKLGDGRPQFPNKRGEDHIRNFVYALLIPDLIIIYKGYKSDDGVDVKGLSVKGVCKKVKEELGIVVIRDSCLREQLDSHGVLKGQVRPGRASQGVGSPSTLGHPTPTLMTRTSVSPRPRPTGIPPPVSLTTTSVPSTSMHHTTSSPSESGQSNITAATRQPSESQPFNNTNYRPQSRTNRFSNIQPPEHSVSQISSETPLSLRFQSEHLEPTPSRDEMLMGMNHEHRPPSQSHFMSSHNDNFENFNTQFPAPAQPENWSIARRPEWPETGLVSDTISKMDDFSYSDGSSNSYHASAPLTLVRTAEFPFNDAFVQLFEGMKLQLLQDMKLHLSREIEPLSRRLDAEQAARKTQADELVKCQNDYAANVRELERYKDLYANQQQRITNLTHRSEQLESGGKASEEARIREQTKCENLQQEYDRLRTRVQKLDIDNGELQSMVWSLEFDNTLQNADIDRVQSDLNKLQTERTELLHGLKETKEENLNIKKIIKALRQQKDNLQDQFENSQIENAKLHIEVARLVEAKGSLAERVELLESECASLQEDSVAPDINPTHKSHGHLSTSTIDSGIGESLRDSVVSTRKRQISTSSIANEHEDKRHRSLQPLGDHYCSILFADSGQDLDQDLDPMTLPIMGTSELPLPRNGLDEFAHTRDEGAEMTFI